MPLTKLTGVRAKQQNICTVLLCCTCMAWFIIPLVEKLNYRSKNKKVLLCYTHYTMFQTNNSVRNFSTMNLGHLRNHGEQRHSVLLQINTWRCHKKNWNTKEGKDNNACIVCAAVGEKVHLETKRY